MAALVLAGAAIAASLTPADPELVRGIASWYRWRPGEAAAGPALRSALGPGWRGQLVRACAGERCVTVRLTDWCGCPRGRVIDLDRAAFALLELPSRGLVPVRVYRWPSGNIAANAASRSRQSRSWPASVRRASWSSAWSTSWTIVARTSSSGCSGSIVMLQPDRKPLR